MIGLDTNILVRILVKDDAVQVAKVSALLQTLSPQDPGYILHVALVELVWVLFSIYDFDRVAVAHGLNLLLNAEGLRVEKADVALKALDMFRLSSKVDFEDCLIAESYASAGCEYTATFDKTAAKHAGMRLI